MRAGTRWMCGSVLDWAADESTCVTGVDVDVAARASPTRLRLTRASIRPMRPAVKICGIRRSLRPAEERQQSTHVFAQLLTLLLRIWMHDRAVVGRRRVLAPAAPAGRSLWWGVPVRSRRRSAHCRRPRDASDHPIQLSPTLFLVSHIQDQKSPGSSLRWVLRCFTTTDGAQPGRRFSFSLIVLVRCGFVFASLAWNTESARALR